MRRLRERRQATSDLRAFGINETRIRLRDLLSEAAAEMVVRPARTAFTMLGTVLGVGALVVTIGIAQTLSTQVSGRFDALRATQVSAVDTQPEDPEAPFPPDAGERLGSLNGVVAGGEMWMVADKMQVDTLPVSSFANSPQQLPVYAARPAGLVAMGITMAGGRLFDTFHEENGERVAVLGDAAAQRLGVSRVDNEPAIFIDGLAFSVIGIAQTIERRPDISLGVIVPGNSADAWLPPSPNAHEVLVQVEPGAGETIGAQLPLVLSPHRPDKYYVVVPPNPEGLRNQIETDVNTLFFALSAVALAIGVIGIANTTLVAVYERTPEFGLRRAVGARPRHIAFQVLVEAATLGTAGGLVGLAIGTVVLLGIAFANTWTAVLDPGVIVGAPVVGTLAGLLAGIYPASKTSRLEPVEALRR